MGKSIRLRAFAKANLSLNITSRTNSGMHELDSVMMSLDAFDTVTVTERGDDRINVCFDIDIDPVANTAYKAARIVADRIGCGVDINIEKGIPVGAGLGGSSADGAAVLRALDLFYGLPTRGVDMRAAALAVGSDVPFMLTGGLARVRGTGGDLFFIENKLNAFVVGLMGESVSTAEAYKTFDTIHGGKYCPTDNQRMCDLLLSGDNGAIELCANALEDAAYALAPSVKRNAELLAEQGAKVCLTGSGGMVLGWFTDIASLAACAQALKKYGARVFAPAPTGILHEWITR